MSGSGEKKPGPVPVPKYPDLVTDLNSANQVVDSRTGTGQFFGEYD